MANRSTYRKLAKKHGVTVKELKGDMQEALNYAYETPTNEITKAYQNRVPRKGETPTVNEFVNYAVKKAKKQHQISASFHLCHFCTLDDGSLLFDGFGLWVSGIGTFITATQNDQSIVPTLWPFMRGYLFCSSFCPTKTPLRTSQEG